MRRLGTVFLLLCSCLLFVACGSVPSSDDGTAATEGGGQCRENQCCSNHFSSGMISVREVGGEYVSVTKLLPSGVESHSFEPSPSDIIPSTKRICSFIPVMPWSPGLSRS